MSFLYNYKYIFSSIYKWSISSLQGTCNVIEFSSWTVRVNSGLGSLEAPLEIRGPNGEMMVWWEVVGYLTVNCNVDYAITFDSWFKLGDRVDSLLVRSSFITWSKHFFGVVLITCRATDVGRWRPRSSKSGSKILSNLFIMNIWILSFVW